MMPVLRMVCSAGIADPGYSVRGHVSSISLRCCRSARVSRTSAASAATSASYSSANVFTISLNVRPSHRARISCAVSFSSTMPSGKSKTLLPVAESLCNRTPFTRRGLASLAISAIGMLNGIEDGPEHIAFKLERANRLALKLRRVAVFQRDRQRLIRIAPRLCRATPEIIKPARIDPLIKLFERREAGRHQIGGEELRDRKS